MTNLYAPKARQEGARTFDEVVKKLAPKGNFERINGYAAETKQAIGTVATFWDFVTGLQKRSYDPFLKGASWTYTAPNHTARVYEISDAAQPARTVKLYITCSRKGGRQYNAFVSRDGMPQERAREAEVDTRLLRDLEGNLLSGSQPN